MGVGEGGIIFSPDNQHIAYMAGSGNKMFVVVDGKQGKKYDTIVSTGVGDVSFDSPRDLHYIAIVGAETIHTGKAWFINVKERL